MLRKTLFQMAVTMLAVMVFAVFVSAQTANQGSPANPPASQQKPSMSGQTSQNTPSSNTQWQASKSSTQATQHRLNQTKEGAYTSMENLWKQNRSLYDEWSKINEHYASMMTITNPDRLKTEMNKHQQMVNDYNQHFMAYQDIWQKDMAAMNPPSTSGKSASSNTSTKASKKSQMKMENEGVPSTHTQ